ncbi:MAG TPA: PEP-CTERM sorting domain-containing protein [Verrucomicrobiae bacterium]|nr:PEP-CTERM sorting domain-containing protein [Verrucomicrobiae bacterium]
MKHSYPVILTMGALCFAFQTAQATLLLSEAFNYTTPGTLGGNVNPSTGYTWTGGNNLTIASGDLTYGGLPDQGGNELSVVNGSAGSGINVFANVTSGSVYYSFLLDCTATPTGNSYLTALNPGTTPPGGSGDALSVYIYSNATGYRLGLRTGGASAVTTPSGSPLSVGSTYFVVVQYDFSATLASLYLNPTPGDIQPAATLSLAPTTAPTAIDNVGFKSQSTAGASYLVDNLLIGTQWADVAPSAVPEPSIFALMGLGLLGLISSARRQVRR